MRHTEILTTSLVPSMLETKLLKIHSSCIFSEICFSHMESLSGSSLLYFAHVNSLLCVMFCTRVTCETGISIEEVMRDARKQARRGGGRRRRKDIKVLLKSDSVFFIMSVTFQCVGFWLNWSSTGASV